MITNTNPSLISLFLLLICFILFHGSYFTACSALEYSYVEETGRGPTRWAQLNSSWYLCGNGTRQSPIAISSSMAQLRPNLGNLQTDYKPAQATLYNRGHDIQVEWNGDAGNLNINGTEYKLLQAHWHTPAEHKINEFGLFAMELHLVHKSSMGQIAVIGALYVYGRPDPFISKLYSSIMALRNGTKSVDLGIVNPKVAIQCNSREKYYRYNGSLTTPPCSENVVWTILKRIQSVSVQQVQALKEAVDNEFEENARPTQPLNGRTVYKNHRWTF